MPNKIELISDIRTASRNLVREFGLLNRRVAGSDLSVSAVHSIVEIGKSTGMSAKILSENLLLEKSTVSRLVKSLIQSGLVKELRSKQDSRIKYLYLTSRGNTTLNEINQFASNQVSNALSCLDGAEQDSILIGLDNYVKALNISADRNKSESRFNNVSKGYTIRTYLKPGDVGYITYYHGIMYAKEHGWDHTFEAYVAEPLSKFSLTQNDNERIWIVENPDKILGSITLVQKSETHAQLRWFFMDPILRGQGVGNELMNLFFDFAKQKKYKSIELWTVKGLEPAKALYVKFGFKVTEEAPPREMWGANLIEQKYETFF